MFDIDRNRVEYDVDEDCPYFCAACYDQGCDNCHIDEIVEQMNKGGVKDDS